MARIKRAPAEQADLFGTPRGQPPEDRVNPGLRPPGAGPDEIVRGPWPLIPEQTVELHMQELASGKAEAGATLANILAPRMVRTKIQKIEPVFDEQAAAAKLAEPAKPFSHFTQTGQLSADEAQRALRGLSLGYTGVWFMRTQVAVCRDCHQSMTAGTEQFVPRGFDGQGPMATVYSSEQRVPNVMARCGVCGNSVAGEVMGLNG